MTITSPSRRGRTGPEPPGRRAVICRARAAIAALSIAVVTVWSAGPAAAGSGGAGIATTTTAIPQHLSITKALGQMIVTGLSGTTAPTSVLSAVRKGEVGSVILMGTNTLGGVNETRSLTSELQAAARAGGNPGLLIMTDQEGGEVKRLPGPPGLAADEMGDPRVAAYEGRATAQLLRSAGVNVDLAPVADVARIHGFMAAEHRTFGSTPAVVRGAACAFARALAAEGVAYTLKHFPGLGDAATSTDDGPVSVTEPASLIRADDAAYAGCGHGPLALVMVSSASYRYVTGRLPAVLSPTTYRSLLPSEKVDAVTISDDFEAPAIATLMSPAMRAINAGLDLVMYAQSSAYALASYNQLLTDLRGGSLSSARVMSAAEQVLALKSNLHLN